MEGAASWISHLLSSKIFLCSDDIFLFGLIIITPGLIGVKHASM